MELAAQIVGIGILIWCFVGPLVGYAVAIRGWRLRSPFTRDETTEEV